MVLREQNRVNPDRGQVPVRLFTATLQPDRNLSPVRVAALGLSLLEILRDGRGIGGEGGTYDIEDNHLVAALLQPTAREIEGLLGTNRPETANGMTIDIDLTLAPRLHIQEGITDLFQFKVSPVVTGAFELRG